MIETKEQLEAQLQRIETWEKEQKDLFFWEKLGRLPFTLLDKITPKIVHEKVGQVLDELGSYVQDGGKYLISKKAVLSQLEKAGQGTEGDQTFTLERVQSLPLSAMDRAAESLASSRSNIAAVQGATTGFGGVFTLVVDIPAVLGMSLKVLQEIAICYGYDPLVKQERAFIVKLLQFASSDVVGKQAILNELDRFGTGEHADSSVSQLQGWREVIAGYRDTFGWKKLFQLVPIAGMLFGAYINRGTVRDVAEAGHILYRKRRILERLAAYETGVWA
jgi:hypothetical protein